MKYTWRALKKEYTVVLEGLGPIKISAITSLLGTVPWLFLHVD